MSTIKLPAASGGGSISIKGPASSGSDVDLLDTSGHLNLADSKKLKLGTDGDYEHYHTGSHLYQTNTTGNWYIQPKSGETAIEIIPDGKVGLRHNNVDKMGTTSGGAYVDGVLEPVSDNSSDLGKAAYRWQDLYLSGNLYIGGTGSANALDDYEEGTFTPQWGGWSNVVYHTQTGRYTKIGNQVIVHLYIKTDSGSTNTSGNQVYLANFPFTSVNVDIRGAGSVGYTTGMTSSTSNPMPLIEVTQNATTAYFHHTNGTDYSDSHMNGAEFQFRATFVYQAA